MMDYQNPEPRPEGLHHYAVYTYQAAMEDGLSYARSFIVIKNGYGVIEKFTRLQDYAGIYDKRTYLPITADPETKLYYICAMLNFVFVENGETFRVRHIFGVTKDMLQQFFTGYALGKKADGKHRGQASIENCVSPVTRFMANLSWKLGGYMKLSRNELYTEQIYYTRKGHQAKRLVPSFQIRGIPEVAECSATSCKRSLYCAATVYQSDGLKKSGSSASIRPSLELSVLLTTMFWIFVS